MPRLHPEQHVHADVERLLDAKRHLRGKRRFPSVARKACSPHTENVAARVILRPRSMQPSTFSKVIRQFPETTIAQAYGIPIPARSNTTPGSDYHLSMNRRSVNLPAELHAALSEEAKRRNVSRSFLIRELIAHALGDREGAPPSSCADLAGDLIGVVRKRTFRRRDEFASSRRGCRSGFPPCCR